MARQYQVTQWDEALAKQGSACNPTVMMSIEDMLNTNSNEITFTDILVGEYQIEASDIGTDNLAVVAKYLIQPYENNELKHPLGAYLCALSDDVYPCELKIENVGKEATFDPNYKFFDIRNVKEWVEHFLIMYSEEQGENLLEKFLENRISEAVAEIKSRISPELASFIEGTININSLINIYEHNDSFSESHLKAKVDGGNCKALFKLKLTDEDEYFKQFDKLITV